MVDIPDTHIEFARELVALARKHSMNNLNVSFDHSGSKNWQEVTLSDRNRRYKTNFSWSEGRHGAKMNVAMERTEWANFEEVEP